MYISPTINLKSVIVDRVRQTPCSLSDLQSETQMSLPTIRRAIRELEDAKWIHRVARRPSTGGRPAALYGLNGSSHVIAGVHLELPTLHFVLASLTGEVLLQVSLDRDEVPSPHDVLRDISRFIDRVRDEYSERELLGLGVATPGYVDRDTGQVLSIGRVPYWQSFPLKAQLANDLQLAVVIENDVDSLTAAELEYRAGKVPDDMLYVGVLEGIKSTLVLNGSIYRGPFGNTGLMGHMTARPDGPLCTCGKHGCLETTASVHAICGRFDHYTQTVSKENWSAAVGEIRQNSMDRRERFQAILEAAETGDPFCSEIVYKALDDLALVVSNSLYMIQAPLLVVGGALSSLPPGLSHYFEDSVRSYLNPLISNYLIIQYASVSGSQMAALGATRRFLRRFIAFEAFVNGSRE